MSLRPSYFRLRASRILMRQLGGRTTDRWWSIARPVAASQEGRRWNRSVRVNRPATANRQLPTDKQSLMAGKSSSLSVAALTDVRGKPRRYARVIEIIFGVGILAVLNPLQEEMTADWSQRNVTNGIDANQTGCESTTVDSSIGTHRPYQRGS